MEILDKYAKLLTEYCLALKEGQKLFITTTTLAEPLVKAVYAHSCNIGVWVEVNMAFDGMSQLLNASSSDFILDGYSPFQSLAINEFDAYLTIKAPFERKEEVLDTDKQKRRAKVTAELFKTYFDRTAAGSLKRCICQYPTLAAAFEAGMDIYDYSQFVFGACKLYHDDAIEAWKALGQQQQHIVDFLNQCDHITYKNERSDVSFSVKGRTWINSDGKANMPSGEVFTGPIEDTVNGIIHFDYPSIYNGQEVRDITLEIEDGIVKKWKAGVGQSYLDMIMEIEGARQFGEVAIGTNYDITIPTKNILFDEKIGGTIHMAIGQSYKQTGGTNQSAVHWDMIADMQQGEIIADGKCIYKNGKFIL